jgi:hypothetical protein
VTLIDERGGLDGLDHAHVTRSDGTALIGERPHGHDDRALLAQTDS